VDNQEQFNNSKMKSKIRMNRKGVFGLTSVQAFFAIILAVALLAYVIIIIMGTLSGANIVPQYASYNYNSSGSAMSNNTAWVEVQSITSNVSTGITSFFGSINPVYAILAVLVIILVLVVLVRVVTGGQGTMGAGNGGVI